MPTSDIEKLLALEHATANKAVMLFRNPLKTVLAMLVALWPGDKADAMAKEAAISRMNLELLLLPIAQAERIIIAGTEDAYQLGLESGIRQALAVGVDLTDAFKAQVPYGALPPVEGLQRSSRARLAQAKALLREAKTLEQAQQAVALASPQSRVEAVARTATNSASNKALNAVAEEDEQLVQVWQAERDGCVHCLAYQGQRRLRGGYPGGLTFGKKPLKTERVSEPPLHPNCRCTQLILDIDSAAAVQAGLLREAKRSVLRGWAVESESTSVRVDAARRLLAKSPAMPKSVEAYARKAVAKGAFARGRNFPGAR